MPPAKVSLQLIGRQLAKFYKASISSFSGKAAAPPNQIESCYASNAYHQEITAFHQQDNTLSERVEKQCGNVFVLVRHLRLMRVEAVDEAGTSASGLTRSEAESLKQFLLNSEFNVVLNEIQALFHADLLHSLFLSSENVCCSLLGESGFTRG